MAQFLTYLRPALHSDCPAIYQVHRHAVRYTCLQSYNEQIMNDWLHLINQDSYTETINSPDKTLWVAEFKGQVWGFVQVDFQEAQLDALYVHPFLHNKGLGTALLQRAEQLVANQNLSVLSLFASENSIPFYILNGYESLGEAIVPINIQTKIACQLMRKFL